MDLILRIFRIIANEKGEISQRDRIVPTCTKLISSERNYFLDPTTSSVNASINFAMFGDFYCN